MDSFDSAATSHSNQKQTLELLNVIEKYLDARLCRHFEGFVDSTELEGNSNKRQRPLSFEQSFNRIVRQGPENSL